MKKLLSVAVAALALTVCGANLLITEAQSYAVGALDAVGLELVPAEGGRVGGPQTYKVTEKTLKNLKAGDTFVVENDGSVKKGKAKK